MPKWAGRYSYRMADAVRSTYGLTCWLCGARIVDHRYTNGCCREPKALHQLTVDHVVPRSRGGSDDISNLRPAHASCNYSRGAAAVDLRRAVEDSTSFFSE